MYVDGAMKFANWWNMTQHMKYKCKFSKTSIVINELGGIYFTYFMTYFLLVFNLSLLYVCIIFTYSWIIFYLHYEYSNDCFSN